MTEIVPTRPEIDTLKTSPFASSRSFRDEISVASTPIPHLMSGLAKVVGRLRDASKRYDGQVPSSRKVLDAQFDDRAWSTSNKRMQSSASRALRPPSPRLEPRPSTRREHSEIDLVGRADAESRVRPFRVVPGDVVVKLAAERGACERNDGQQPRALILHRLDEPLDDGEAVDDDMNSGIIVSVEALNFATVNGTPVEVVSDTIHVVAHEIGHALIDRFSWGAAGDDHKDQSGTPYASPNLMYIHASRHARTFDDPDQCANINQDLPIQVFRGDP